MANPRLIKIAISFGEDLTAQMADRQNRLGLTQSRFTFDGVSLAVLGASHENMFENDHGILIVVGLPVGIEPIGDVRSPSDVVDHFQRADGAFTAFYWDKTQGKLTVVTDFMGMQPIYSWKDGNSLHFATETKAFNPEPDPAGWGAFLSFGHVIGERTLAQNVKRLPGGSIIEIDAQTKSTRTTTYWSLPVGAEQATIGELAHSFRDSIEAYAPFGRDGTVLLSGGYDSRVILYGLMESGIPVKARIFAHSDENFDADRRIAERLARRFAIEFDTIHPDKDFFSTAAYLDYISDTDAQIPSLHLFIAQLGPSIPGPAIWEGWGPGPALGSRYFPGGGFDTYLARSCAGPGSDAWDAAKLVLQPDFSREMETSFRQDLDAEVARFPNDDNGVYWFFCLNRSRNRVGANTFKAFPQHATTCLPGLSKTFWEGAASVPQEEKVNHQFYRNFLAETYPDAMELPFVTGSTLMPEKGRFSPYHYLNRTAASVQSFLGARPSLARTIPFLSRVVGGIERSHWLDLEVLAGDDPYIDQDRLSRLNPDDPLYNGALTFLFHWKAWRWLHQGCLKERLL